MDPTATRGNFALRGELQDDDDDGENTNTRSPTLHYSTAAGWAAASQDVDVY